MRWSLILSTFAVAQSVLVLVCFALPIPSSPDELSRRANWAKSNQYRKNSQHHAYQYQFHDPADVTRTKLKPEDRSSNGKIMLKMPKIDADHVFEHQMLKYHLQAHKLTDGMLSSELQKKVAHIMNGKENVKGQVIKHGMKDKAIAPKKGRDEYMLLSYGTAKKTAQRLDNAFAEHGHDLTGNTFQDGLSKVMRKANILKPGQPSPPASSRSSSFSTPNADSAQAGARRPISIHPVKQRKPKVITPTRKSVRIATMPKSSKVQGKSKGKMPTQTPARIAGKRKV